MKLAAIVLLAIGVCSTAAAAEPVKVTFRATVQEVVMLSQYSGVVRVVHFDPRYVVTLTIVTASPDAPEFMVGETVALAIHSPTLLFIGDAEVRGKTFTFAARREIDNGKPRFSLLEVVNGGEQGAQFNPPSAPRNWEVAARARAPNPSCWSKSVWRRRAAFSRSPRGGSRAIVDR